MPYADLGKQVKQKYPGVYDSIADDQLGQQIVAKYPQYADLSNERTTADASKGYKTTTADSFLPGRVTGRAIGQTLATPGAVKQSAKMDQQKIDTMAQLTARIKKAKAAGDTKTADRLHKLAIDVINEAHGSAEDIATGGEGYVTGKQVVGDAARMALTFATASGYNPAATTGAMATKATPIAQNALQKFLSGNIGKSKVGNLTSEAVSKVVDGRPLHQALIEKAANAGDWATVRDVIKLIPKSDPYKAGMEAAFEESIKSGIMNPVKQFLTNAAGRFTSNALSGAGYGAAESFAADKSPGQIAKDAATTGAITGAVGTTLEGVGALVGKGLNKAGKTLDNVGKESAPLEKTYKTTANTLKYQKTTVPDIIKKKGLADLPPKEVEAKLTKELSSIGDDIGNLSIKARSSNAKVNLSKIAGQLDDLAESLDRGKLNDEATAKQVADLRRLAENFDGQEVALSHALELFRKYNKALSGKFGKETPALTTQANQAIRGGLLDAMEPHSAALPDFDNLNKNYGETKAALASAAKAVLREANKTPKGDTSFLEKLLATGVGTGTGVAAVMHPAVGIPMLATEGLAYGAHKALKNPKIAGPIGKALIKAAQQKPVNNALVKFLLNAGVGGEMGR